MVNIEAIVYYGFLLDSLGANMFAWCFPKWNKRWHKKHNKGFWKHLPVTKGWTLVYLILVLWVGWALYRLNVLPY